MRGGECSRQRSCTGREHLAYRIGYCEILMTFKISLLYLRIVGSLCIVPRGLRFGFN